MNILANHEKVKDELLIRNGYEPIATSGKRPVGDGWQKRPNTIEAIAGERTTHPTATNTGLRTGRLVGADIDLHDPAVADGIESEIITWLCLDDALATWPMRRVGSKGCMLAFRNETPIGKITVSGASRSGDKPERIEFLGAGQQFVAFGIHPDTGKPYRWDWDTDPTMFPIGALPEVTPAQLRDCAQRVAQRLTELGYSDVKVSDPGDPERASQRAQKRRDEKIPVPVDYLSRMLAHIDPSCGRNEWIGVIGAIQATQLEGVDPDEMDGELLDISVTWSAGEYGASGTPGNYAGPEDVEATFWSLDPMKPGGSTFGSLYHQARENGWTEAPPALPPEEEFAEALTNRKAEEAKADAKPKRSILRQGVAAEIEAIDWIWDGWLARRKLHLIAGDKGAGKSTLTFTMAAATSAGGQWPDGTAAVQGSVLIWSSEDDWRDTILPRLDLAGADLSRCYHVAGDDDRPFDPATDMPALLEAARDLPDLALLIVDPVVCAVAGDSHKNAETRRGLQPLLTFATRANAAVLGITHFTKGTEGQNPTNRVTGSLAFAAIARIVMVAKGPDDGTPGVLTRAASNIGRKGDGFEYGLMQEALPDRDFGNQRVQWGNAVTGSAADLLGDGKDGVTKPDEAKRFLDRLLADGAQLVTEIKSAADAHGISWRTIERAKAAMPYIRAVKDQILSGEKAFWRWVDTRRGDEGKTANPT